MKDYDYDPRFKRRSPQYHTTFRLLVTWVLQHAPCNVSSINSTFSEEVNMPERKKRRKKIRYAVVGLGYISQTAVLPAFKNASKNSELVAFVSDDPEKMQKLSEEYNVGLMYSYAEYEDCLQ